MGDIYRNFYSLFNTEKEKLDRVIAGRQDSSAPILQTPLVVGAALLGLGVSNLLLATSEPRQKLEDHPMCGITTGGQAECYFDCEIFASPSGFSSGQIVTNLECLKGCVQNQCVNSLLTDVLRDGICYSPDYYSDYEYDEDGMLTFSPLYEGIYNINNDCTFDEFGFTNTIVEGTCSAATEEMLVKIDCIHQVFEQPGFIQNTIQQLIQNSCNGNISDIYIQFQREAIGLGSFPRKEGGSNESKTRLAPFQSVLEFDDFTLKTDLNFTHTRDRYSWVCSLRSVGAAPEHLCAVTLLSTPPTPTVVVGAAHCTYLCRNERGSTIPVCCCSEGVEDCSDDRSKCGEDPKVFEMTGEDGEILCGEWETGPSPTELSGEKYNVVLGIKEIVRHPNFNAVKGPIGGSDIAVFKVDDSTIQNRASSLRLYPICLPTAEKQKFERKTGIHAGWSKPPPFHFVEEQATGYLPFYRDFFKLWHYKMDILDKCQDPRLNGIFGGELEFPSNTSYPAGTVCAKDFSRQSCFSTGDSGSPLMVREETRPMRFYAEGISSFVKGCDVFTFGPIDDDRTKWQLNQQSENPSTYTKLSCFLPWVAEQYGLEYTGGDPADPECYEGQGDPLDGENKCTITPSNLIDTLTGEVECIFPFYYKNKKYDGCVLFDESGFVYPVFRCPTRNITTKIDGINSYPAISLTDGLCPSDDSDSTSPLDPDREDCSPFARRAPFSQCKNNCPGVRAFGILGGGAVLGFAGADASSALQLLGPAALGVGTLGAAGIGGGILAQSLCVPPYCRAPSQQCCLVTFSLSGPACPDSC